MQLLMLIINELEIKALFIGRRVCVCVWFLFFFIFAFAFAALEWQRVTT